MFREYIELIELSKSLSNLDRAIQGKIIKSGKEIVDQVGTKRTVVKVGSKAYLVRSNGYARSLELLEVDVVVAEE